MPNAVVAQLDARPAGTGNIQIEPLPPMRSTLTFVTSHSLPLRLLRLKARIGAVAVLTVFGSRLVEEYRHAFDVAKQLVTVAAAHVLVRAFQRERCFFVIEERRFPFRRVVAVDARSRAFSLGKLAAMNIQMAVF